MKKPFRVLFINPPLDNIVKMEMSEDVIEEMGHYPPLGLLYLATYLGEKMPSEVEARIVDCVPENVNYEKLRAIIAEFKPVLCAITTFTPTIVDALLTAKLAKETDPCVKVALGGHHVDSYPAESLAAENVDYICKGEGEESLLQLVKCIISDKTPDNITGVGYKKDGRLVIDDGYPFIKDLDSLPIPDRGLINNNLYTCTLGAEKTVATVMSSRGCPYTCTFCYCPTKNYRMRTVGSIIAELKEISKLGIREIFFFDDLFNVSAERVTAISRAMIKENLKFSWSFRGRVNNITDEMLKAAKEAGCERIHYGIETSDNERLNRINKKITVDMIKKAVKLTRDNKVIAVGSFMIGLPGETKGEIYKTFRFMRELGLDYAQISVLMPYPNTALYKEALEKGVIKKDFWKAFAENPIEGKKTFSPEVWAEKLSQEELFRLINVGYRQFYMRPSYVLYSLLKTKSPKELASKIHAAFVLLKEVIRGE